MVDLERGADDDAAFVMVAQRLIHGAVETNGRCSFYVVKVDNWFGPKWLGFDHKILGIAGVFEVDGASPRLVPPFTPSRIVSTRYYAPESPEGFRGRHATLHRRQTSEDNSRQKLKHIMPADGAFWWSGSSRDNGRGAVMAYLPGLGGHIGWYAGFKRVAHPTLDSAGDDWSSTQLRGIARKEIGEYIARAS